MKVEGIVGRRHREGGGAREGEKAQRGRGREGGGERGLQCLERDKLPKKFNC